MRYADPRAARSLCFFLRYFFDQMKRKPVAIPGAIIFYGFMLFVRGMPPLGRPQDQRYKPNPKCDHQQDQRFHCEVPVNAAWSGSSVSFWRRFLGCASLPINIVDEVDASSRTGHAGRTAMALTNALQYFEDRLAELRSASLFKAERLITSSNLPMSPSRNCRDTDQPVLQQLSWPFQRPASHRRGPGSGGAFRIWPILGALHLRNAGRPQDTGRTA